MPRSPKTAPEVEAMLAELAVLKAKLLAGVETPECIYRQLAPFQEAFRRMASLRQRAKPSLDVVTVEEMKAYAAEYGKSISIAAIQRSIDAMTGRTRKPGTLAAQYRRWKARTKDSIA